VDLRAGDRGAARLGVTRHRFGGQVEQRLANLLQALGELAVGDGAAGPAGGADDAEIDVSQG
jgi:hypothetical protein